ncbi:hypothetical protein VTI74DRAFT_1760 [Chaetomium olivicolor]
MFGPALLVLLTAAAALVAGQEVWDANQVNTKICQWQQLRAALLRDTVYLDGGNLWWEPGFVDGSTGPPVNLGNPYGRIYTLNLSTPFNTTQNISAILGTLSKTAGGGATNLAPNYYDGALLANNEEFFLYGGLFLRTDAFADPPGDSVLGYQAYQYGPVKETFRPQFVNTPLGENVTRYIAYGGAANAPSENLAWYFSGFRSPSAGPVYVKSSNKSISAVNVSSTLITLDMARQQKEVFKNATLPPDIPGRANPELVWVPVGSRGILVALGGVVYPDFDNTVMKSTDETASKSQSPGFMSTIDIYDVAGDKWYRQKTVGGPGQLTRGCAVVATAQDRSSFNIYYYGGYDGLRAANPAAFNDDVWVLSLPSFTWVNLAPSTLEGRAGHKCVTPYPDQMFVIGGNPAFSGPVLRCLKETIRVFNLSTGKWQDKYDPAVWANYTVPSAVVEKIGGSGTGGATVTTPSPSGFDDTGLATVFATQYPTSKITTYYPYASVGPINNTNPNAPPPPPVEEQGGGLPSYLPPVLGVVLGLVFLTMVAVLILLWRRRKLLRRGGGTMSEAGTEDTNGHRIKSWLRGQPSEIKASTSSSSEYTPVSMADVDSVGIPQRSIAEMMDTEVRLPAELPDTSPPAELHDNALSAAAAATTYAALNDTAKYPTTHQTDHASSPVSADTPSPAPYPSPPPIPDNESPIYQYRPDSDAIGRGPTHTAASPASGTGSSPINRSPTTPAGGRARDNVLSGISDFSDRERSHLRQISDTTVSSVTTTQGAHGAGGGNDRILGGISDPTARGQSVVESPAVVSPPTTTVGPGEGFGGDYLTARPYAQGGNGPGSPLRRSVFSEDIDGNGMGQGGRR